MNLKEISKELEKSKYQDHQVLIDYIIDYQLINQYTRALLQALELEDSSLEVCPRCNTTMIKKDGQYKNGLQRYYCRRCNQTFSPHTGTILERSKLTPVTWLKYMLAFEAGAEVKECSDYAGVSLKGAYAMKDKILKICQSEGHDDESI